MHTEAREFTQWVKTQFPKAFANTSVWDVGGGDINGNNRGLFQDPAKYVCNDVGNAPNVTHVCKTSELPMEGRLFDVIVSTECFEHDCEYGKSFAKILGSLKTESVFFSLALQLVVLNMGPGALRRMLPGQPRKMLQNS